MVNCQDCGIEINITEDENLNKRIKKCPKCINLTQELNTKINNPSDNLSEENIQKLGQKVGIMSGQSKAKLGKFIQEDLKAVNAWASDAHGDIKSKIEGEAKKVGPKVKKIQKDVGSGFTKAQIEADKLANVSKNKLSNFKSFIWKYRFLILIFLISLIFFSIGRPEYILYIIFHVVMIIFAAIHTLIGILSLIFDNLFGIEFFMFLHDLLYTITYMFYMVAFKFTNSVEIWLQLIHIFR
jgi:hypothetical protein